MEELSSAGIVIREQFIGESDKLLTVLTEKYGKIFISAKGTRNIAGKNAPACQLFVYSDYEFIKKGGRHILKRAYPRELFFNMRCDSEKFALVSYFSQILCHVTMENNDELQTLRLFLNTVYALSQKERHLPLWQAKAAFELGLMCRLGLMPDLYFCGICSEEIEIGEASESSLNFSFETGSLICPSCLKKSAESHMPVFQSYKISHEVLKAMRFICENDSKKFLSFSLSPVLAPELSFLCEKYLIYKTERNYDALKIYHSISNSINTTK